MDSISNSGIDINYDDDEDDDEMADLFSFGAVDTARPPEPSSSVSSNAPIKSPSFTKKIHRPDSTGKKKPNLDVSPEIDDDSDDGNNSRASNDSFIELLENAELNELSVLDGGMTAIAMTESEIHSKKQHTSDESDLQEILDWLDDDDEKGNKLLQRQEEELVFVQPPRPPSLEESIASKAAKAIAISTPKAKVYDSLEEAVRSRDSSKAQIRRLLEKEKFVVNSAVRPHLWAKVICDKTLEETLQSSLADSFQQWEQGFWENPITTNGKGRDSKNNEATTTTTTPQQGSSQDDPQTTNKVSTKDDQGGNQIKTPEQTDAAKSVSIPVSQQVTKKSRREQHREWLEQQSSILAARIVSIVKDGDLEFYRKALLAILVNYFNTGSNSTSNQDESSFWKDTLLPPVLCSILSSGVPPPVACVMLSQIIPSFMPILALTTKERQGVATILHDQFYLLACYHLPLLVLHLDKYISNWYKCPPAGQLPQSWLISHLAGETDGSYMNIRWLLHLWDLVLTSDNNSLRFFFVISILDLHAERLLLLTDDDLKEEFHRVISFSSSTMDIDGASMDHAVENKSEEEMNDRQSIKWVQEWSDKAVSLWEETPVAVIRKLQVLEDEAVTDALAARQKAKEELLRLQQEAEENALHEARETERERKAEEARKRLTRARLVAFYRQYNPGKENNIDKIMISYDGRFDVLDSKLKMKYGVSFNPALPPKPTVFNKNNSKIFASMNTSFGHHRTVSKSSNAQKPNVIKPLTEQKAVVEVPPSEILPIICWSKDGNRIKLSKLKKSSKVVNDCKERNPLKFYLVDSRTEAAAREQGRLPTSVSLSPENLADVRRIKEQEAMFESLRGSVHICIMGEGYASLPDLYGHKITSELAEMIKEDGERNNACARFFLSGGFPFVSLVEGGFASVHAYLCREGPKTHLHVSNVLIDYNQEVSLFGRFEKLHSMSGRDKAQRALQNLFDSSMTALTKNSMRLEEQTNQKSGTKSAVQRFFGAKMGNDVDGKNNIPSSAMHDSSQIEIKEKSSSSHIKKSQDAPPSPSKGLMKGSPFSRFGGLGIGQNMKRSENTPGKANKFAGSLNNFRKNTMARMKQDGNAEES